MNPIVAFVVVMLVWTVSEYVARKTKSLLSSRASSLAGMNAWMSTATSSPPPATS